MNTAELLADCQILSRDFSARAFQPQTWMRLINDANEYAATIARKSDPSYLIRVFSVSGAIPTSLTFLPDDLAAIMDVRFVRASGGFVHAQLVSALGDVSDEKWDVPRYRPLGRQIELKGGWLHAGLVTRTEIEYQRSAQPLFRCKFSAGEGTATPTIVKITDAPDPETGVMRKNEEIVVRTDVLQGVSIENTSGAGIGQRRNITAQAGAILTLDSAFSGATAGSELAVVPPWPEDVHPFISLKAVHTAFAAENNPRGTQSLGPALQGWEDRFRRAIESRVEGRRFEILDVRGDEQFY